MISFEHQEYVIAEKCIYKLNPFPERDIETKRHKGKPETKLTFFNSIGNPIVKQSG